MASGSGSAACGEWQPSERLVAISSSPSEPPGGGDGSTLTLRRNRATNPTSASTAMMASTATPSTASEALAAASSRAHHTAAAAANKLAAATSPPNPNPPSSEHPRPVCIVVDDDDLVSEVVVYAINRMGRFEVATLGSDFDEQEHVEEVLLGMRSHRDHALTLPPPYVQAAAAVIDMHLGLLPDPPPHLATPMADGTPRLAVDGIDLARRLRARGYEGKIILHSAESLTKLEEYRNGCEAIDDVVEKGNRGDLVRSLMLIG